MVGNDGRQLAITSEMTYRRWKWPKSDAKPIGVFVGVLDKIDV